MKIEESLKVLIADLFEGRLYPDTAPGRAVFPLCLYQQVGGRALWKLEGGQVSHRNARLQIHIWARSREEANALAGQVEAALAARGQIAQPYGAFVALYDEMQELYGTRQDFGIWRDESH
jgi:hypothetical protein